MGICYRKLWDFFIENYGNLLKINKGICCRKLQKFVIESYGNLLQYLPYRLGVNATLGVMYSEL